MQRCNVSTWLVTDGHAGNVRQAQALAQALGVQVQREWQLSASGMAGRLAPRLWPGAGKALGAGFADALRSPPQLVIGCGRQGALASRLARRAGAKAVQILDPRISPNHFDAVIAPLHDGLKGRNVIRVHGSLHSIDDAYLAAARQQFAHLLQLPSPRVALLLGGPSAHLKHPGAVLAQFHTLAGQVRERGGSLITAVSRRTPMDWFSSLYKARAGVPGMFWRGEDDGANPYPGLLACSEVIVCTPDSVNMLSEAAATRVPVQVLAPEAMRGRPAKFLQHLLTDGRVSAFNVLAESGDAEPLRETARVAQALRQQLGLSN